MVSQDPQSSFGVILEGTPAILLCPFQRDSRTDHPGSRKNDEPGCCGYCLEYSAASLPITLRYSPGSTPSERCLSRLPASATTPGPPHAPAYDSQASIASGELCGQSGTLSAGNEGFTGALGTTGQNHPAVSPSARTTSKSTRGALARSGCRNDVPARKTSAQHCDASQIEDNKPAASIAYFAEPALNVNESTALRRLGMAISDAQIRPDLQLEDARISAEDVVTDRLISIFLHIQYISNWSGLVLRPSGIAR
jgi:hypothetical protein